jgi:hypothetical protein
MPTINLGRVGFVQKGVHSLLTPYKVNDVVTSDGQVYACILANTGEALSNTTYWSPWITLSGIISDDTPLPTKAYSGEKTQLLHDIQAEAIANLATASGKIASESSPVFQPIPLVLTDMPFTVVTDSTDTGVFEFDNVNNTITFKIDASFNFLSNVSLTSSTAQSRDITFSLINTFNDTVVTTEGGTFDFAAGVSTVVPFNTLLTLGKNGMPSAPLTIKIQAMASGTGYTLDSFSSILASSNAYESPTTEASQVVFTPYGSIEATTVQIALQELDTEKAIDTQVIHTTGDETKAGVLTFTSIPKAPTATVGDNTTNIATTAFVKTAINAIPAPTIPDASETAKGIIELATSAEVQAGTDAERAVTPAGMKAGLNASGTAPIYACRAWVNFNGTGTVSINASSNISSITDVGVDDYRMNFSSAMPRANYAIGGAASNTTIDTNNVTQARVASINGEAPTTTTCRISYGGNGTYDKQMCTFFIVG